MFAKVVFFVLGTPVAVICALLAPLIYIAVIAVSPLGLVYRYVVRPFLSGAADAGASGVAHRPTA
ncbi:MAG TPA: hypothetical protein VN521_07310 [Negativicutes bacterium]|nr:hypothetical protein [Negativicutes bacterium]